jgi:hypothetical protein
VKKILLTLFLTRWLLPPWRWTILRNVGECKSHTALHPRRQHLSCNGLSATYIVRSGRVEFHVGDSGNRKFPTGPEDGNEDIAHAGHCYQCCRLPLVLLDRIRPISFVDVTKCARIVFDMKSYIFRWNQLVDFLVPYPAKCKVKYERFKDENIIIFSFIVCQPVDNR